MNRGTVAVAAVVIVALTHESACAKRLLTATVELDEQAVLETKFSDNGTGARETVWRYLGEPPGWTEQSQIEANSENPLQADLAGELVIRIQHVDRPIVDAEASTLVLVRDDAGKDKWYMPADEVERIAKLNGIAEPSPLEMTRGQQFWWILGEAVVALVAIIGIFQLTRSKRRSPSAD